jgi:hypothetical protein
MRTKVQAGMKLPRYGNVRGYQESMGCLLAGVLIFAIVLTALGYWIGSLLS